MFGWLLLIVLAAIVFVTAKGLLYLAGERRASIAVAASFAILIALPVWIGRLTHHLPWALFFTGLVCLALLHFVWRAAPPITLPPREPRVRPEWWAAALAILGLFLMSWAALGGHFWDEFNAHFGVTNALARGVFPAEHPQFPGEPFRYHYGFDVLAAIPRSATNCCVERAIDLAGIACYALLLWLAFDVGVELGGRRGGSLALVLAPLGSGPLQIFLFREFGAMELSWSVLPASWSQSTPPPVISNFFQHPQGLGMPISLAVLLLFSGLKSLAPQLRFRRALAGASLLGVLSISQIVFFGVMGLALGLVIVARTIRSRDLKDGALQIGLLLGALLLAFALGGFLAPGPRTEEMITVGKTFFNEPFTTSVLHHLALFGLPLIALPIALARLGQEPRDLRLALGASALIGFAVPNLMTYDRSWDIVKFFGIGAFFANLLLADVLARFARPKLILIPLILISTTTAWFWLVRSSFADGRFGVPAMHFPGPPEIAKQVSSRLERMIGPYDRVLSTNVDMSTVGLLTPGFEWRMFGASYMLDRARADELRNHLQRARRDLNRQSLLALDVKILVLSPADINALSAGAKNALNDPLQFEHLFDVSEGGQHRKVYRLVDAKYQRTAS